MTLELAAALALLTLAVTPQSPEGRPLLAAVAPGATDTVHVAPPTGELDADRTSIRAALDAVQEGGTVQFAAGTYLIGEMISVTTPSVTLLGHPDGTTLRGCNPEDVAGMQTSMESCNGLELAGARQTVRGFTFEHAFWALHLGCCYHERATYDFPDGSTHELPVVRRGEGGHRVEGNTFRSASSGIRVNGGWTEPSIVRGNRFIDNWHAISINGHIVHVLDNHFSVPHPERVPDYGFAWDAIKIAPPMPIQGETGPPACIGNVIAGNTIEGYLDGIRLEVYLPGSICRENVIRDNTIAVRRAHNPPGSPFSGGGDSSDSSVVGVPIALLNDPIVSEYAGSDAPTLVEENIVEGNRIVGAEGLGIEVLRASRNRIANNVIERVVAREPFPGNTRPEASEAWQHANGSGIWISPGSDGNEIVANTFVDVEAHAVALEGDGNRVELRSATDHVQDLGSDNRIGVPAVPDTVQYTAMPGDLPHGARTEALERLTYSSYRPAGWDLYLYTSPGSEPRRLTDHPALDYDASFSPDGRWIVFTSERDGNPSLYVLDLEGDAAPRLLVRSDAMQDQAALSPDGRWIAFVSTHGGDADIYLLPFTPDSAQDVSSAVNLTNHPGGDFRPAFSPDGTRIAFTSDRDGAFSRDAAFPFVIRHEGDVYVVNVDGSGLQRVTNTPGWDGSPTWSEDGKSLLFYSERDERVPYRIHEMALEGGEARPIGPADRPALSPVYDGNGRIAFATWTQQGPAKRWQVATIGNDGGVRVVSDPAMNCLGPDIHRGTGAMVCHGGPPFRGETIASFPGPLLVAGSPQRFVFGDRTVALSGVRHAFTTPPDPSRGELLVREAPRRISFASESGEGPSGLLDLDEIAGVTAGVISHMRYSHDGQWVSFTVGPFGGPPDADADVWRVRTDGSGLMNLTPDTPGNDGLAEFSADGTRFVFRSGRSGDFDIYLADADGSNVRNLTNHPANETFPAFSPRGDQIAFVSDRNGILDEATGRRTFDVYTLDLEPDGTPGTLRQITRNTAQEGHVGYSPDGEWLVYTSGKAGLADEAPLVQEVLFNPQMYGEIYAYHLRDRTTVRVTHNKWEDGAPIWALPARGQPRPAVADVLAEVIEVEGADAAAARYRELQESGLDRYRLGEGGLYRLAHRYLRDGRVDVADETFRLLTLLQPAALRPLLEHAATLLTRGDTSAAVARYREVLARHPEQLRAEWSLLRAGALAEVDLAPDLLAGYAGDYGDPPFNATVLLDGAQLLVELPGAPAPFPLLAVSDTRFYVGQVPQPLQIRFVAGEDGGIQAIEVKQEGFSDTFVRK